jgi:cholesterol oxidase
MPMEEGENLHGVRRFTCELLGECNAGCNLGAKNTLDLNYLRSSPPPVGRSERSQR